MKRLETGWSTPRSMLRYRSSFLRRALCLLCACVNSTPTCKYSSHLRPAINLRSPTSSVSANPTLDPDREDFQLADILVKYLKTTAKEYADIELRDLSSVSRTAAVLFSLEMRLQHSSASSTTANALQADIIQTSRGELYLLRLLPRSHATETRSGSRQQNISKAVSRNLLQSDACTDVEGFVDEKAYPCSTWSGYNCTDATHWGYTAEGTAEILANCQASCEACEAAAGLAPPPVPSADSTECADVEDFRDEKAYPCSTWSGYDCTDATRWGYTAEGTAEILANCPASCEACEAAEGLAPPPPSPLPPSPPPSPPVPSADSTECTDVEGFVDEKAYPCSTWSGYNCTDATHWGYTAEGTAEILANCQASCEACEAAAGLAPPPVPSADSTECADVEDFRDEKAYPCSTWSGYDCTDATRWGYTAEGTAEILANCPASCEACEAAEGLALPPPSPLPPSPPVPSANSTECADVEGFYDEKDYPCSTWSGYNCTDATHWGYAAEGTAEILANCPASCGTCKAAEGLALPPPSPLPPSPPVPSANSTECADVEGFYDEKDYPCSTWSGYNCTDATHWGYAAEGTAEILANCPASCGTCKAAEGLALPPPSPPPSPPVPSANSTECADVEGFQDESGSNCSFWIGKDCSTISSQWGYSREGEEAILASCLASCDGCKAPPPPLPPPFLQSPSYDNCTYIGVESGTCEFHSLRTVEQRDECETASILTGFSDATASPEYTQVYYPRGCYVYSSWGVTRLYLNYDLGSTEPYGNCSSTDICICGCMNMPPPPAGPPGSILNPNGTATISDPAQSAEQLDSAVASEGVSVLYLRVDVYLETGTALIERELHVLGQCHGQRCIIDGSLCNLNLPSTVSCHLFHVGEIGVLTVEQVQLQNGQGYGVERTGGAIFSQGKVMVVDCLGTSNYAYYGGFVYAFAEDVLSLGREETPISVAVVRTTIDNNMAERNGGAIYMQLPGYSNNIKLSIMNSTITNCSAGGYSRGSGGAIYLSSGHGDSMSVLVQDSTLTSNAASENGGAMYLQCDDPTLYSLANVTIVRSSIENCSAPQDSGGGLHVISKSNTLVHLTLVDTVLAANSAFDGGGIYASVDEGPTITIPTWRANASTINVRVASCIFVNNSAEGSGGAIHLHVTGQGSISMVATGTNMSDNLARTDGGALSAHSSSGDSRVLIRVEDSALSSNLAEVHPRLMLCDTARAALQEQGGGLALIEALYGTALVSIRRSALEGNRASTGNAGAISAVSLRPGFSHVALDLWHTKIASNAAGYNGGALYMKNATAAMHGSWLGGNLARSDGGALYAHAFSALSVDNGTGVERNMASSGGGIMVTNDCREAVDSCVISENIAMEGGGGGLIVLTSSSLTLRNSTVTGNAAATFGGGVYMRSSNVSIEARSELTGNSAAYEGGCAFASGSAEEGVVLRRDGVCAGGGELAAGVHLDNGASLAVRGGVMAGNAARSAGGGLYAGSSTDVVIEETAWVANTVWDETEGTGAGISVLSGIRLLSLENSSFIGGLSLIGAGVYLDVPTTALHLHALRFENNSAVLGNNVMWLYTSNSTMVLPDCTACQHSAGTTLVATNAVSFVMLQAGAVGRQTVLYGNSTETITPEVTYMALDFYDNLTRPLDATSTGVVVTSDKARVGNNTVAFYGEHGAVFQGLAVTGTPGSSVSIQFSPQQKAGVNVTCLSLAGVNVACLSQ
ncbi:hypothetical protein CYMTET_44702, partial [Cymbomonas tetramitiformis]